MSKKNIIQCRIYNLYAKTMVKFYKLINLNFIPTKGTILNIDGKIYKISQIIINYDGIENFVDLYIETNKDKDIEDIVSKKDSLYPTHLANQDKYS